MATMAKTSELAKRRNERRSKARFLDFSEFLKKKKPRIKEMIGTGRIKV
jgi:hypothetical protein